jgi:nicotinate-nucleotide adenylyltransferase
LRHIGIFGGSFDPVHVGHLALARTAIAALGFDVLHMIPTGFSWQKQRQLSSGHDRISMLNLAVETLPNSCQSKIFVDPLETLKSGPSYSYDTLLELRKQFDTTCALTMVLGSDQLRNFNTWYRWQDLLSLCNLAVTQRESISLQNLPDDIDAYVQAHGAQSLAGHRYGKIAFFSMPPVAVSSTGLRQAIATGQPVNHLVPEPVLRYIAQKQLYKAVP